MKNTTFCIITETYTHQLLVWQVIFYWVRLTLEEVPELLSYIRPICTVPTLHFRVYKVKLEAAYQLKPPPAYIYIDTENPIAGG